MNVPTVRQLFWNVKKYASAFGLPGAAAMLLFALCAAFGFFTLKPLQAHIVALRTEAKYLRAQSAGTRSQPEQKTLNPAEQLAEFYRFFPRQESASDWMATLYNAAAQQNLNLDQGEYRLAHDRDGKLTRYDIVLPVKGGYVQLRKFIAQALAEVPSLSLDGIAFNRQKIGDAAVDAQLRFTLYLGDE